jgi:hypothetical protein
VSDMTKGFAYVIATGILVGVFYALIIYPYQLDADVKLWLTGAAGAAMTFVFGDQASSRGARQALQSPEQTVTVDAGPPATATVGPTDQPPAD